MIHINGHFLKQKITGVQRYAREIIRHWEERDYLLESTKSSNNIIKHVWMQTKLKNRVSSGKSVLWSPTNIGPLNVTNQVLTLHDISDFLYPEWFSVYYTSLRRYLIPKLVKRIQGIITVSEYSRSTIIEYFDLPPAKVISINNGVDRNHFKVVSSEVSCRVKKELNLPSKYILTLGSLDPRKNLKGTLKAWDLLKKEYPSLDLQLVVVGGKGNNFNNSFSQRTIKGKDVIYLGYIHDDYLPGLYSGASAFAYPSLFEGFGLPVLEAMSCGTPVITSDTGALKEIGEGAAELIDPNQPEEIAQSLLKIITSNTLSENLVMKGLLRAEQYSWEKSSRKTFEYLQKFL